MSRSLDGRSHNWSFCFAANRQWSIIIGGQSMWPLSCGKKIVGLVDPQSTEYGITWHDLVHAEPFLATYVACNATQSPERVHGLWYMPFSLTAAAYNTTYGMCSECWEKMTCVYSYLSLYTGLILLDTQIFSLSHTHNLITFFIKPQY